MAGLHIQEMSARGCSEGWNMLNWPGHRVTAPLEKGEHDGPDRCRAPPAAPPHARGAAARFSLDSIPGELYEIIFLHVPVCSMARLALCTSAWNGVASLSIRTERFWSSAFEQYRALFTKYLGSRSNHVEWQKTLKEVSAWCSDVLDLMNAVFCRCDGPEACTRLFQAVAKAALAGESVADSLVRWSDIVLTDNGLETLGRALSTCPRSSEWTAKLVVDCFMATDDPSLGKLRAHEAEDAFAITYEARTLVRGMALRAGFSVSFAACLALIACPCILETREERVLVILHSFGDFGPDEYLFDAENGTEMGAAVAEMGLPLEDVLHLVESLDVKEAFFEEHGLSDERGPGTVAFLSTWASSCNFPTAHGQNDVHKVMRAIAEWDPGLKALVMPVVLGWLRTTLEPLGYVLESPALEAAVGWLAALQ